MNDTNAESGRAGRSVLRAVALFALLVGALGSLGFMFSVGRNQKSVILIGLFTGWVVAPFAVLSAADRLASRLTARTRAMIHATMIILALSSLAIYGTVALGPPRPQPSFMFLMVPAVWLALLAIMALIARNSGERR